MNETRALFKAEFDAKDREIESWKEKAEKNERRAEVAEAELRNKDKIIEQLKEKMYR